MTKPNRNSCLLIIGILSILLLWVLFSTFVVSLIIASAYRGESLPFLNSIISWQAVHPVGSYLAAWKTISWRVCLAFLMFCSALLVVTRPEFQRLVDAWHPARDTNLADLESSVPMGRRRTWLVYAVIAGIIGGSLFDIITDSEQWPFSQYTMYSGLHRNHVRWLGLAGTSREGEIHLQSGYCPPFDNTRLAIALRRIYGRPDGTDALGEALRYCAKQYEALRLAKIHNGPPLQAIRLYELEWEVDILARNKERPDSRKLISEVTLGDRE